MLSAEEKLALLKQAWKEVFEVDDVQDDADFFEEGGDSIKAVQLSSWLVQKGIKLDLGKIFYTPILSDMAQTLEETDAMYVPDQLMTKELMKQKYEEVMRGETASADMAPQPKGEGEQICDPEQMEAPQGEQICDPEQMEAPRGEQICDPEQMEAPQEGQICDPEQMEAPQEGQICDPEQMEAPQGEQICDPEQMEAPQGEQICDPEQMEAPQGEQICDPEPHTVRTGNRDKKDMMGTMLKMMISQQQMMLQMMEIMADMIVEETPAPSGPPMPKAPSRMPSAFRTGKRASSRPAGQKSGRNADMKSFEQNIPKEKKAELGKMWQSYQSRKVEAPIEKPNVIGISKAKVAKPEKSAEEVLDHVLSGLLKNGFNKTDDLFEQGLTSLDTVKMVSRCGEHGYSLKMQDIYMHSTFAELVKCMTPGE